LPDSRGCSGATPSTRADGTERLLTQQADSPGVRIPPPLFYVAAIGAGALLRGYAPLSIGGGGLRVVAAWLFVASSAGLFAWSFLWFARQKTTIIPDKPAHALVLDGPFRFTRNPLYLAMALLTMGAGLWLNTWWVLLLLLPAVAIVDRYVIAREEAYLRRRFGIEYDAYIARVRRWL
jgi:protein-S-isoprenylcysteine O-methyltransferase Ste14